MKVSKLWLLLSVSLLAAACGKQSEPAPAATSAATTVAAAPAANAEEKVLNVYNWPDYIAKDMLANFEKETGIKVNYRPLKTTRLCRPSWSLVILATTSLCRVRFLQRAKLKQVCCKSWIKPRYLMSKILTVTSWASCLKSILETAI
jgi:hypothetical protein